MPLRPGHQWPGQNLSPAFPSQEVKPDTGSFAQELELRAGRWLTQVSASRVRSNNSLIKWPETCQCRNMPFSALLRPPVAMELLPRFGEGGLDVAAGHAFDVELGA